MACSPPTQQEIIQEYSKKIYFRNSIRAGLGLQLGYMLGLEYLMGKRFESETLFCT